MTNPSRRKGTKAENGAVAVFATRFPYCERRAQRGRNDAGDLTGLPIPVEVKWGTAQLPDAMKEAKAQAGRLESYAYGAYVHARGKPPEEAYGVVPAWFLCELLDVWQRHGSER